MAFCDKVEVMIQESICHRGTNYVHYIRNSSDTAAVHCAVLQHSTAVHCSATGAVHCAVLDHSTAMHCSDRALERSGVIFLGQKIGGQ